MALSSADQKRFDQEQVNLEPLRQQHPEYFISPVFSPDVLLKRIGILYPPTSLPIGCVKASPLDFIVEEIRPNGWPITVDGQETQNECEDGEGTVYVDLTKIGLSTIDAIQRLQDALHIEANKIGHAGIKDAVALTAQRLSLRGVSLEQVRNLHIPGLLLRNVVERKGAIGIGNLYGNRFTLFIRTKDSIDQNVFLQKLESIQSNGVMNYYGTQRFGTPRYFAHEYGMKILRGDFLGCIKQFLTQDSPFEIPLFSGLRKQAAEIFGNWAAMEALFSAFPYTFRHELLLIESLKQDDHKTIRALGAIGPQTNMWVRAYASYLTNMRLSEAEANHEALPQELPLLLGKENEADVWYAKWLKEHGTEKYADVVDKMNFIQVGKNPSIEPKLKPMFYGFRVLDEGVAMCFDLQKGAYATTVLMNLFETVSHYPAPSWLNMNEVDLKEVLGIGSLHEVKEVFKDEIERMKGKGGIVDSSE